MKINFKEGFQTIKKGAKKNAPLILTVCGVGGSILAFGMAFKVAPKAKAALESLDIPEDMKKSEALWEKTKVVAPIVAAPVALEAVSIACICGSYKSNAKRLATLSTAYALSESRFRDYRKHVIEEFGKKKDEKIQEKVVKEKMDKTPNPEINKEFDDGKYWCLDAQTERWFRSTRQEIEDVRNELNRRLMDENYISLNDFYDEMDNDRLKPCKLGDEVGWNADNCKIDFKFYPVVDNSGNPALGIDFYVGPRNDYRNLH